MMKGNPRPFIMKLQLNRIGLCGALLLPGALLAQSLVIVSLEEFHQQTSASTTTLNEASFYALANGVIDMSGGRVFADSGVLPPYPPPPQPWENLLQGNGSGEYEYKASFTTQSALLNDYPVTAAYNIQIFNPSMTAWSVDLPTLPGGASFTDYRPDIPLFNITGVSGTWYVPATGPAQFRFVPAADLSFTVALNPYVVALAGSHRAYFAKVRDVDGNELGEVGSEILAFSDPWVGTELLTFTYGLGANTDGNDSTYGFVEGSVLVLEAAFYNLFGLSPAGLDAPNEGVLKAFVFGAETQFVLVAIPESAHLPLWLAGLALLAAVSRRPRRE
jgi:hypothetical protein